MAQKTNPTALRIAVIKNWRTVGKSRWLERDTFLRKLVRGLMLSFGYFTSEILIKKFAYNNKLINLTFLVYPNQKKQELNYCAEYLKLILRKYFPNHQFSFHIREINSLTFNAHILKDFLKFEIASKPKFYTPVFKKVLNNFKKDIQFNTTQPILKKQFLIDSLKLSK